jgi:hypothetical protein
MMINLTYEKTGLEVGFPEGRDITILQSGYIRGLVNPEEERGEP